MPTIKDIIGVVERFAPLDLQQSWDNSGVQVGRDLGCEATGALLALDVTREALEQAKSAGANLLISHHPLLFEGLKAVDSRSEAGRVVIEALDSGVVIYSSHTPLDSCKGGINDFIANKLSLGNVRVLESNNTQKDLWLGRVGDLPNALSVSEFCGLLKSIFDIDVIRHNQTGDKPIKRVAICGGSGGSLLGDAIGAGVDAYICGDLKYHNFAQAAQEGVALFDIGHYESEICSLEIFSTIISNFFPTFATYKFKSNFISYYGN